LRARCRSLLTFVLLALSDIPPNIEAASPPPPPPADDADGGSPISTSQGPSTPSTVFWRQRREVISLLRRSNSSTHSAPSLNVVWKRRLPAATAVDVVPSPCVVSIGDGIDSRGVDETTGRPALSWLKCVFGGGAV